MKNSYKGKKVLVFGLGLNQGGVGSANFFAKLGAQVLVTDLKNEEVLKPSLDQLKEFHSIEYHLGKNSKDDIDWADLIIKNPAVKPGNELIAYARSLRKKVETDIGILLENVGRNKLIGVTGTKGKSTTASLIYEALKAGGKKVLLAGNIGKSVLDVIPHLDDETLLVLEISSFQLEGFDDHQVSPKYSVITNIMPDHLNYYKDMDEYIAAKKLITKYQGFDDFLFLRKNDPVTTTENFLSGIDSQVEYFSKEDLPTDFKPRLLGEHNLENIDAALQVARFVGLDEAIALQALTDFQGVEFRMQLIKQWRGIRIYNDTAATTPDAALQAIKSLPNSILIAGGMNKGLNFKEFAEVIAKSTKAVFFIEGDATDDIMTRVKDLESSGKTKTKIRGVYNNLEDLLLDVKKYAKKGDIILFSPGATSFNLFQNEFDRGRKFNEVVEKVFN